MTTTANAAAGDAAGSANASRRVADGVAVWQRP